MIVISKKARKSKEKKNNEMTLEELKQTIPPKELPEVERKANEDWQKATLSNNDVFINFCNNKNVCKALVDVMLAPFDVKLNNPTLVYEKSANKMLNSKEVKFDLYVEDDYIIIDMEMQVVLQLFPPNRARSYQAIIDVEQLKKCKNYNDLKDTYIVIICLEDPFGFNSPAYRIKKIPEPFNLDEFKDGEFDITNYIDPTFDTNLFNNIKQIDQEKLDKFSNKQKKKRKKEKIEEYRDGANIIYFNASLFNQIKNKELRSFLGLVCDFHTEDCQFYHLIKHRYDRTKSQEEARLDFMLNYFRQHDEEIMITQKVTKKVTEQISKQFYAQGFKEAEEKANKKLIQAEEKANKKLIQAEEKANKKLIQAEEKANKKLIQAEQKAYNKKVDMVLKMINKNYDNEEIQDLTDFTLEEIAKIREEHTN